MPNMSRRAGLALRTVLGLTCLFALSLSAHAGADNANPGWPHMRGPELDGKAHGAGLESKKSFGLERVWRIDLGSGFSGIVAAEGRVLTMFSDGDDDVLAAFDPASGEEMWRYRVGDRYPAVGGSYDGPLSTPLIQGQQVFAFSPRGRVFAVSLKDGKEQWSMELSDPNQARRPTFGFSSSPLWIGGLVVLQTGGEAQQSIIALDPRNGKVRWSLGDDSVQYQSPFAFELDGKEILVAVGDQMLVGVEPSGGEILWQQEHGLRSSAAMPSSLGARRLLINGSDELLAMDIEGPKGGPYTLAEAWRSSELVQRTYARPILEQGVLYGFSSRFLTAVDAASGERIWRSRPPGGRDLIMVDGHLVTLDAQGELVIGSLSREGFEERARAVALAGSSYTAPSYADGFFYVRDLESMSALRITDQAAAETSEALAEGELGRVLAQLPGDLPQQSIDRYLADKSFPIVEEDGLVHFLYRGDAKDVAVSGLGLADKRTVLSLQQVPGTNVWVRSTRVDPNARRYYRLTVDFDNQMADPGNPERMAQGDNELSVLTMPGWRQPPHRADLAEPAGRLTELEIASERYEDPRKVSVYLPPGYQAEGESYPLLMVAHGQRAMEEMSLPQVLDRLMPGRVQPLVAVFLHPGPRGEYRRDAERVLDFLAEDLVPQLEQQYNLRAEPQARAVVGTFDGGHIALHAALKMPQTFGRAAAQSYYGGADQLAELSRLAQSELPGDLKLYLDWTQWERTNRAPTLATTLTDAGLTYVGGEVQGTAEWPSWAERIDRPLEVLFPGSELQIADNLNQRWLEGETSELVQSLERDGREIYTHRQLLADTVAPARGSVVADIGAGSGFMLLELARRVGPQGKAIGVDINAELMQRLQETARAAQLNHVDTVVCREDSVGLPANSVDLVFLADTYHHFAYPKLTLDSIRHALRPQGEMVLVDFERIPGQSSDWVMGHVRAGKKQVIREVEAAGFQLVQEHDLLPLEENYVLRFRQP